MKVLTSIVPDGVWVLPRGLVDRLRERFPALTFFFQPADIVAQILNFGLPAPIDVQIVGRDPRNEAIAHELVRRIAAVPGASPPSDRRALSRSACRRPPLGQ